MNGFYERNNPLASNTIQANYRGRGPGWRTGINTRVKLTATTAWVAFLFLSFFPPLPPSSPLSSVSVPLWSSGDANASLLFQSLSLTARHWLWNAAGQTFFRFGVNRSRNLARRSSFPLATRVVTRNEAYVTNALRWNFCLDIIRWINFFSKNIKNCLWILNQGGV